MSRSGKFSPGRGSSKKNKSLGAIEEDKVLLSALDEADPEEGEGGIFSRHELFESELSQIDGQAEDTESRPGTSVFIDLEAEERAFVSGSQQYLDAVETIRQLRQRLVRRTSIIDEIRKYYLRDVVTIKHIMKDILTAREREQVLKVYDENLPSIDLTQALKLHAPTKCELQVAQCGECGGQLEIVMKDSDEVDMLKKTIMDCKDRESRFRIKLATLDAQIENTLREKAEGNKSHAEEKKFLYAEMKKVKAEVERVQKEVSALNKTNKRAQAENEQLRTQLVTVSQASTQLAQQTEEIESLRSELQEVSTALKTSRHLEKTATKELGERTLELKTLVIQSEEQAETIKILKKESTEAVTQINSLKVSLSGWVARHTETAEECKNTLERANELEAQVAFYASEKERLLTMADASDETLQGRLIEAEEGCAEYREENRRIRKDIERFKRQLEKSEDSRLVLAHELEMLQHEKKQSEEELLSMQNFIHTKIPIPTASAETVAESAKVVEDLLQSIKVEARQRVGEAPVASARVASVKLQRQQRAEARAKRGGGDTSEVRINRNRNTGPDDSDDDDIGNFDSELDTQAYERERDEEDRRSVVSATTKKRHKKATKKKERSAIKSTVSSSVTTALGGASISTPAGNKTRTGGTGKTKKPTKGQGKRRPSLEDSPRVKEGDQEGFDSQDPHDEEDEHGHGLESETGQEDDTGAEEGHVSDQDQTGETEGIAEHPDGEGEGHVVGAVKVRTKKSRPSKPPSHPPTKGSKPPKSREPSSTEVTPVKAAKRSKAKSTEKSGDAKRTGRRRSFENDESHSRQGSRPGSRPTTRGSATGGVNSRRSSLQTDERLSTTRSDAVEDEEGDGQEEGTGTGRQSVLDYVDTERAGEESDEEGGDGDKKDTGRQEEGGEESRVSSAGGGRRSAGSRTGKSPKTTARSLKSNPSEDWETASMGSREGVRRIRSTTPGKREITSLSIKAAAMELPEVVSARSKKTITKITPVLDKKHSARRNSASRLKKSMASRSSRSSSHGCSDGEEDEEGEEGGEFEDIDEEGEDADSSVVGDGDDQLPTGLNTGATNTAANSDEDEGEDSSEGEEEDEGQTGKTSSRITAKKSKKHQSAADSKASMKGQKAPSAKIQVATYDLVKKQGSSKHSRGNKESGVLSPLAMGSPIHSGAPFMSYSPQHGGGSGMPPPRRRRSLPKCYSFSRPITGLGSRLPSMDSADAASLEFSQVATAGCSPVLGREAGEGDNISRNSYASGPTGSTPDATRIAQLHDEFTAGMHRVPDPPSIRDEDGLREGARIRTYVPIIPIEVKRYVDPKPAVAAVSKKKFVLPVEEPVELEPLPEGHTALEEQLRVDLLKSLSQAAGVKPNDMHRAVNATKEVLHSLCVLHEASVKSAWSALQTSRAGLDLHYLMRHVAEGMARCADGKTGTVELAETVKRLLPLAGMSMAGPAVSNKWQEELKLNPALVDSLFPAIDAASGKYSMKDASEFFNTKAVGSTNTGVLSVLQEKAQLAEESAQQMRTYAASCSKFVTDKLVGVLKDWAKAKGAFYEMDSKIAAEKEKVRKVLEARIGELTKEKVGLSTVVLKHEERIKALESTEAQLQSTQFQLKKATGEVQGKLDAIRELEDSLSELHDEVYQRKTQEKELGETIESLSADIGALQLGQEELRNEVSKEQATLQDTKVVLGQVSEERDHFQAQYERMVRQEDSRLNKLVHVQIQSEPAVRDLAIQTEFVAPPMTLRTIVASKNARGGMKAPLVMSQSLEVPSSCEPGALTSVMVDTLSSTFHPMSRPGTVMTAHSSTGGGPPGSSGGVFSHPNTAGSLMLPIGGLGTPPGSSLHRGGGTGGGALSARSVLSIDSAGLYPGPLGAPSPFRPQEGSLPSSPPRSVVSREDSFLLNASDFLSSALPIDYEKSNRGLTSTEQMARLLSNVGDESSVSSSRTHSSSKFPKKKAVKLGRLGGDKAGSSGHYQHVHLEESVPQWGSVHGPPSGGTRVDPGVVLGISGVGGVGSHTSKVYGTRGEFGANSGHVSNNNTLSAAGSSLFRTSSNPNVPQPRGTGVGREVEVNLPEVRTQSYNLPAQRVNHFSGAVPVVRVQQQPQPLLNLALEGGGADHPPSGDSLHLMLDSPSRSLGGSSAYPGFDFERDRRNPLRIAGGDLPASQEAVQGIVYNNRSIPGGSFQQAAYHTADEGYSDNTGYSGGGSKNLLQSASQGSLSSAQLQKTNAARLNQKIHAQQHQQGTSDSAHSAVSGVSEEVLKRLRKELLSR